MAMISDIKKFSWPEACSNDNGKTSGSGTMGILVTTIGAICFAGGCIVASSLIITNAVIVIGAGSALLGVRKWMNSKSDTNPTTTDEPQAS